MNWSVNLETEEYASDRKLILKDAIQAIRDTTPGSYVNLAVTEAFGDPADYLVPELVRVFQDKVDIRFIDQCGCGGYVFKVRVEKQAG